MSEFARPRSVPQPERIGNPGAPTRADFTAEMACHDPNEPRAKPGDRSYLAPTHAQYTDQRVKHRRLWLMGALCLVGGVLALAYAVGMVR